MQCGGVEFRRRATFHVSHLGAFVGDDEGALELAEIFRVDPEVGLERMFHFHAGRHVDEGAAAEDGAVERAKFVVANRNNLAEPFPENFGMIFQSLGRSNKDDALFADGFLDVGVNRLAVELRFHAGEKFSLLFRNAEPLECALDVLRHFVPTAFRSRAGREVITDFVEIDCLEIFARPMRRQRFLEKCFQTAETKFADPIGIFLDVGDVVNGFFAQSGASVAHMHLRISEIADAAIDLDG